MKILRKKNRDVIPNKNPKVLKTKKSNASKQMGIPKTFHVLVQESTNPLILASHGNTVILGNISSLYIMSLSKYHFIDGTFKVVLGHQGQLFVVHCLIDNLTVSALFIKTNGKDDDEYKNVLKMIYQLGLSVGVKVYSEKTIVKCDFENGIISAFRDVFPQVRVNGCLYHFKKAINDHFNKVKLSECDKCFSQMTSHLKNLPLLPIEFINQNTLNVIFEVCLMKCKKKGDKEKVNSLKQYMNRTWTTEYSIYPPTLWNVYNVYERTNNYSESSNRYLNEELDGIHSISAINDAILSVMKRDKENF